MIVERYVPQPLLFDRCDAVMSHNAAACERICAGITPAAISEALERLLTDKRFRVGAREGAASIQAMPPPDEVAGVIEQLGRTSS